MSTNIFILMLSLSAKRRIIVATCISLVCSFFRFVTVSLYSHSQLDLNIS